MLSACGSNGASQLPSITQAPLAANTLEFAVGTVTVGYDANAVGLNVVTTLRQPSGQSILANTPTITGPAGFTVPATIPSPYSSSHGPNVDAGTNHISGSPQVPRNNAGLINSTFGTFNGVMADGIWPFNSDQSTSSTGAYYTGLPNSSIGNGFTSSKYCGTSQIAQTYANLIGFPSGPFLCENGFFTDPLQPQPFYSSDPMDYVIGPPAVPFFNNGTQYAGFAGYPSPFNAFEVTPVAGQYQLSVNVAATNTAPITYKATATLASAAPALGPMGQPTFNSDGKGGGSGSVSVPSGVTETLVYVVDLKIDPNTGLTSPYYFTVGPLSGTGTVNYTLPDNLGACNGANCQNGSGASPTIASGDVYFVSAVGYDYPAFEMNPPGNMQAKPAIAGANGQADVTLSPVFVSQY
jgi:hypothetical protein